MGGPPGPPFSHPGPSCRNPAAGMPAKFCNRFYAGTFNQARRPSSKPGLPAAMPA